MNKLTIYRSLTFLVVAALFIAGCTKEQEEVKLDPALATLQLPNITSDSAIINCYVVAQGEGFIEKGACFGTLEGPTTADNKVVYTGETTKAAYTVMLRGLTRLTKYYVRPYGITSGATVYGEESSFTTPAAIPAIADIAVSVIANTTDNGITATTEINITDDGGPHATADITSRGVVYGTEPAPTVSDELTAEGTGAGEFTSLAKMLKGNVKYYLRAYATNSIGTTYSNEVSFTTPIGYAFVTTGAPTSIAKTSVTFNGLITYDGAGAVSESGFCYGLNADPVIDTDTKVAVTPVNDTLTADITGLEVYTTYHVRAFITNDMGTNYGADVEFTTLPNINKFFVVGSYNGWNNSATAEYIISTTTNPESQGYVYLTAGAIKLTTDHSWDVPNTFGDDGAGGLANPGGDITVATDGYYLIKANRDAMTYSLTLTTWGVIGAATADGWSSDQNMTYSMPLKRWFATIPLAMGEYKFRANDDWVLAYGDNGADGTLEDVAGAANMSNTTAGTYSVILNLATPNNYTYALTTWGLIGGATVGGWGTDTEMTPASDNTWTVTTDLTVGTFKFRANNAWTINLGGAIDNLTFDGSDMSVAEAGNYTIVLDLVSGTCSLTKN